MNTPTTTTTDAAIAQDPWTEGVKFAVREMAKHPVAFCTDSMVEITAKLIVDAALKHRTETPATAHGGDDDRDAVIACLGDDAAGLLSDNPEDERAHNMLRAAELLSAPPAGGFVVDRITEAPFYWRHCKQDAEDGYCNGWNDCVAAHASPTAQPSAKDGVRGGKWHGPTLDAVLRGLRSEDDSTQLRAIISSVETMREEATTAAGLVDEAMVERALDAQPFTDRNDGVRVWQFIQSDERKQIMRAALEAAIGREVVP